MKLASSSRNKDKPVKRVMVDKKSNTVASDKVNALSKLMADVSKKHGDGSLMKMGESPTKDVGVISSGSIGIDYAFGIGGYPRGRIVEVFGPEASGKTTLTLHAIAECQRAGGVAAFIDAEHALDLAYARNLGINVDDLLFSQPDYGEQALNIVEDIVRADVVDLVVVDSVAALTPKAEIEADMEKNHIGLQARMMSQALRKLTAIVGKTNTCLMFINQTRCLPLDTYVMSSTGVKQLGAVNVGDRIIGAGGEYVQVLATEYTGTVSGKLLHLAGRGKFRLSDNHLQVVVGDTGIEEVSGESLDVGDWLVQPVLTGGLPTDLEYVSLQKQAAFAIAMSKDYRCKAVPLPQVLDEDFGRFLGMYYSDGYLLSKKGSGYRISFTENNRQRFRAVYDTCVSVFGEEYVTTASRDITTGEDTKIFVSGKVVVSFLKEIGVGTLCRNKIIPACVMSSRFSVIREFVRGAFFDTHGFSSNGFIFANENLASLRQFSQILYACGVFADLRKNTLCITADDAVRFTDVFGFIEQTKAEYASEFRVAENGRGKRDVVPHKLLSVCMSRAKTSYAGNITEFPKYSNLNVCRHDGLNAFRKTLIDFVSFVGDPEMLDLISNNRFVEVLSVEDTSFPAMDIEVSNGLFVADQFLTHNSKIGVMFGDPTTTPGGTALKFYCSIRAQINRVRSIKEGDEVVGNTVRVKVVKNKLAPPFKQCVTDIVFGKGINRLGEIVDMSLERDIIEKAGAWYKYDGSNIGQGRQAAVEFLRNNDDIRGIIEERLLKELHKTT